MRNRIFASMFCACLSVMLVCIGLITGFLYRYYTDKQIEGLESQLVYIVHMVEEHSSDHIIKLNAPKGILLADKEGNVLLQNSSDNTLCADEKTVDMLLEAGGGSISTSIDALTKQITVGQIISEERLLCLTDTHYTFLSLLLNMSGYIILVLGVAVLLSLSLARWLSRKILRPVYELDLSSPDKSKVYPELLPLIHKIDDQKKELQRRIQDKEAEHQAQDRMRREFTANVSHELKTPLTSISGYAEIIRDGFVQTEDIPRFAGKIYDESKRMITLVGDIIKLSQLDDNEISVRMERLNLFTCCQDVISNLEPQAKKKNVSVTLRGEELEITGAEVIIEEIIYNIIDNAIKYNRDGGKVEVALRQCIDGIELSVKDTGIGIPEEDIGHVFERFYRADKSHSKEIGGTGLGLSIVKHGVMFHNAYVSLESKVNKGTTVRILF